MRVLITGITGFVGSHLAEYLVQLGCDVHGTTRPRSNLENLKEVLGKIKLHDCNIVDAMSVLSLIRKVQPTVIHHLAAQTFVPTSWNSPQDTFQTNVVGTINLLEAARRYADDATIHICGSSEEYGLVEKTELPVKEEAPLRPMSPYAVSKIAADLLGQQYFKSYQMAIVISRAFNHTGPRRGECFVTSNIAKQLVLAERGLVSRIWTGDLNTIRDLSDVRDIVNGYWLLVNQGTPGEVYNISSQQGHKISKVIDLLASKASSKAQACSRLTDQDRLRPSDVPVLIGDSTRIRRLGWKPKISLEQTLEDLLIYWRKKLK